MSTAEPLDLLELFATPWEGEATVRLPWWLRWVPFVRTRFTFRTVAFQDGDAVTVRDTQTFPNGRVWVRTMRAVLIGPGRWRMSADDMPGGAEITVRSDGYSFTPYTIVAPVLGPVKVPLRCRDEVVLIDENQLRDTIEFRFLGIRVGVLTMQPRRI